MAIYDTPTDLAAATLVHESPVLSRLAQDRGWLKADGALDLDAVVDDLGNLGYLSGAEFRLVRTVSLLHQADLWGLDEADALAAAAAFQAAAGQFSSAAEAARLGAAALGSSDKP